MVRFVTIAGAMLALSTPAAAQQGGHAALERAIAAYKDVHTVRATFTQRVTNPLLGRTVEAKGEVVQDRPDKISIRFTDPAGDRIVSDGSYLWIYLPSSAPGQVIKQKLDANAAGVPDVTASFLEAPRSKYSVRDGGSETINGRAATVLHLTARDNTLPYTKATVWVDRQDGLVRQFEITEPSGLVRRVIIDELRVNPKVDAGAFRFEVPRGARVVEG
ncbi:MAG TPA: outer membrane lipoprotein carrier protein LolA [Gemmatimonadaceae bacterium]|nr:outer membrane lipoprotein carrier protein LolA [Gemmatimonadaceae bacterium]